MQIPKATPTVQRNFNFENVNLLTNSNINPKNGVAYKKVYVQNKHEGNKTKTKSMRPELLKTLNMNQL